MFGFHAISELPISTVAMATAEAGTGEAFLGSKFSFDDGFNSGFKSGTLMPVTLGAKSVMTIAGSSSLAKGFGLNADGSVAGTLLDFSIHLGVALLQSDSIFSSKGVLLTAGRANLEERGLVLSDLTRRLIGSFALELYVDRERDIISYLDIEKDVTLYLDQELNKTLSIDQSSSKTSYIDKELLVEI